MRKKLLLIFMLTNLCFMTGCLALEPDFDVPEKDKLDIGYIDFDEEISFEEDYEEDDDNKKTEEAKKEDEIGFYYERLSEEHKNIYLAILNNIKNHERKFQVYGCEREELQDIFFGVLYDHPEIYWVKSYKSLFYRSEAGKVEIEPDYFYNKNDCKKIDAVIEETKEEFLVGALSKTNDYEKILYTYEFIIGKVNYGGEPSLCQNIDSTFMNKKTVCAGYAKGMKYLLDLLDIDCIYAHGEATNDEGTDSHAWNIVKCEGNWCFLDATWGDPYSKNDKEPKGIENISYYYFCNDEKSFSRSHSIDNKYQYPSCTTNEWNYYVVNDMYYKSYDKTDIISTMEKDIVNHMKTSTFLFENKADYQELIRMIKKEFWSELDNDLVNEHLEGMTYYHDDQEYMCEINWEYK